MNDFYSLLFVISFFLHLLKTEFHHWAFLSFFFIMREELLLGMEIQTLLSLYVYICVCM